jgi:4-hydroxyacetophenone monooxygenase
MRNPHAGEPFTTSDQEIAEALLDVSVPALMLSLVHMSGDPELIRGRLRPAGLFLNEVQGYLSEEDKAGIRALALDVIRDHRDRGCPDTPAPASTWATTSTATASSPATTGRSSSRGSPNCRPTSTA